MIGVRWMWAQVDQQCVIKANAQFWEQMLAMTLDPTLASEEFCVQAGHIVGSVSLSGKWKGLIEVRMAGGLAYAATAAMMMQSVDSIAEADALDATREIANMIAGTIKSSLPRPCSMAVPESAVVRDEFRGWARTDDSLVVGFRHASGVLVVRVWEHECLQ